MEITVIDSSVLITSSLFWSCTEKNKKIILKQKKFSECEKLFVLLAKYKENFSIVITKTVEIEATSALKNAVDSLLNEYQWKINDIVKKYNYFMLRNLIYDRSLDRMEDIIEEYSTRFPMNKKIVKEIMIKEIETFFKKTMPDTIRYIPPPRIIKRMPGSTNGKRELITKIIPKIPSEKILYIKGEPKEKDKQIMAEATYIRRVHKKEKIFLASLDYHYIPNPTQIDTYKSSLYYMDYANMDTRMRDLLMKNFGFFSARPKELLEIFEKMGFNVN